jgi:ubiquitin related modifier 1
MVRVHVEFTGGMDLLFGGTKEADIDVSPRIEGQDLTVVDVMVHCRDRLLTERPELFMKGDTVCAAGCLRFYFIAGTAVA